MRALVQRVSQASVKVSDEVTGSIHSGLLVLIGVGEEDTQSDAQWMAQKITGLRIFQDEQGKMNLNVGQVGGDILAVSQFTLFGDCKRGRRPSFTEAAPPEYANTLFEYFVSQVRHLGFNCPTGRFRTHMEVNLTNDGPVTLWLDTQTLKS